MDKGVLVGCDVKQEWLLSWWWGHFYKHNREYRVAFADFGMSEQARGWCKERGELIAIAEVAVAKPVDKIANWEKLWRDEGRSGEIWMQRTRCFQKPAAMVQSPFHRTLWIDLDCEIRGDLEPIFSIPLSSAKMGAASWESNALFSPTNEIIHKYPYYNSGVVLFEKDSSILHRWAEAILEGGALACTDDELLSFLAVRFQIPVTHLPILYNWEVLRFGFNPDALIFHWMNENGKEAILRKIYLDRLVDV